MPARLNRTLDYFSGTPSLSRAYEAFRGVFTRTESARIRRAFLGEDSCSEVRSAPELQEDGELAEPISQLELKRYLRNQLLRDADTMSMAHGVELRVPLLDVPLYEVLRGLDPAERFGANKRLLRAAVPELPVPTSSRRKRGFDLPFASWLRSEWSDLATGLPPLPGVSLQPWYRQWTLIVLTRYLRRHGFNPA